MLPLPLSLARSAAAPFPKQFWSVSAVRRYRQLLQSQAAAMASQPAPDRIAEGLFLSSCRTERSPLEQLRSHGITHVLQVGSELQPSHAGELCYKQLPVLDKPFFNIASHFNEASHFISQAISDGACSRGWPQSLAVQGTAQHSCACACSPTSHRPRLGAIQNRRRGAGALPGGHLALRHHRRRSPDEAARRPECHWRARRRTRRTKGRAAKPGCAGG